MLALLLMALKVFMLLGIFFIPTWLSYKFSLYLCLFGKSPAISFLVQPLVSAGLYYFWWHAGVEICQWDARNLDDATTWGFGLPLFFASYVVGVIICLFLLIKKQKSDKRINPL